ncbi:hypothetical protein RP20_CCG019412 [Aedes albopictus]|nr:hypothetical protein RP20_CCG019412 [Aedes albopictus]
MVVLICFRDGTDANVRSDKPFDSLNRLQLDKVLNFCQTGIREMTKCSQKT